MIFYRISDNSYPKLKLPGSNKETCFINFKDCFKESIEIIADSCHIETLQFIDQQECKSHQTYLGNAGSVRFAFELAINQQDDIVYFVEDDYLHHPNSSLMKTIKEGLGIADYVTLYDHPDKYTKSYDFGETSKVVKTASTHWRYTISTCMTFATTVKTLKEDYAIWEKHISSLHPDDHDAFIELKEKGRRLVVCIPGKANHCDLMGKIDLSLQESWAVELMTQIYLKNTTIPKEYKQHILKISKNPYDTLKMLSGLIYKS